MVTLSSRRGGKPMIRWRVSQVRGGMGRLEVCEKHGGGGRNNAANGS